MLYIFILLSVFSVNIYAEHWFNNPEFQKVLDEKTASKAHTGNQVSLLINGIQSLPKRLANISSADVIFLKTFEFWDDQTGNQILDALIDRAQKGAKVFISFDVKGTFLSAKEHADIKKGILSPIPHHLQTFLQESQGNGFLIPTSSPYSFLTNTLFLLPHDHEKYLITWNAHDPVKVIMGGMNTGDMYLLTGAKDAQGRFKTVAFYEKEGFEGKETLPLRDTDIEVVGTVTQEIISRYIESCSFQLQNPNPYFQKNVASHVRQAIDEMRTMQLHILNHSQTAFPENVGDAFVRFIFKPANDFKAKNGSSISNFFTATLDQIPEGSEVQFATGYFLPTKLLWKAIYSASKRGVEFDILSNATYGPEITIAEIAMPARPQMKHFMKTMPADSIRFYEWQGNPTEGTSVMHQKVSSFGLADNDPCCIGSCNLDGASLFWNSEDILVIQSPAFKKQFNRMLKEDFAPPNAQLITLQELEQQKASILLQQIIMNRFLRTFL
jgi:phosphatidylserine/phosphatidylglycerophosphate/cardiolipin synthase-like enzyme